MSARTICTSSRMGKLADQFFGDVHNPEHGAYCGRIVRRIRDCRELGGSAYATIGTIRLAPYANQPRCAVRASQATYGRVSTRGVIPLSWSLDHVGPFTATSRCGGVLQAAAGYTRAISTVPMFLWLTEYVPAASSLAGEGRRSFGLEFRELIFMTILMMKSARRWTKLLA